MQRRHWVGLGLLAIGVFIAYAPAIRGGFLWDDNDHVTRPELRTWHGLYRIWFDVGATPQYYPLLHGAFWVEYQLWGNSTTGYHLVNILLHVIAAWLVFLILRQLAVPGGMLAAAIFALHPIQVESVAWITELKNTQSAVFYLAAMLMYLRFDQNRSRLCYALALGLFVLGLLSKTVTATLPAALLVIFWWQRGKLSWKNDALPLAPLFLLGAAAGMLTAWVERTLIGASGKEFQFTLVERCLIAGRVVWFYFCKLLWPSDLTFIYPRWHISQGVWWQYLFPIAALAAVVLLWIARKKSRAPLAGILFFGGTLFPVLGFFNVYPFQYSFVADHFVYLASLGVITLVSGGIALILQRYHLWCRPAGDGLCLMLLALLGCLTWRQAATYADVETLYRTTLARNPDCWLVHNNLGNILQDAGESKEAIRHYREALRSKSDYALAHNNLGTALQQNGRLAEAVAQFQAAINADPAFAEAHVNWGDALQRLGEIDSAMQHYQRALQIKPDLSWAHYSLGNALQSVGRLEEAIVQFRAAVRLQPGFPQACNNWGNALTALSRLDEAVAQYQNALRFKPNYAEAEVNWGNALRNHGRIDEAVKHYQEALRIKPDCAEAYSNWGSALKQAGRVDEAIAHYQRAVQIKPDYAEAHVNWGNALQGQGRFDEAVGHFQQALRINPDFVLAHYNLGVALESLNRFKEAIEEFREAVRLRPDFVLAQDGVRRVETHIRPMTEPAKP